MADGAHATAYQHLLRAYDQDDPAYHPAYGCAWLTYLAEAAVHCGQVAEARAVLDAVEPALGQSDAAQLDHALGYARAVLADDDEAEPLFEKALSADLGSWQLDSARLQLAWGMWLRRRRRPAESRAPLRRARDAFDAVGALAWAAQARRELRAAGERSLEQDRRDERLTAQELQIARLAALGLTNREIGQRIFASHRTVASHMYRIFPKLGITSRRQLHQVLSGRTCSASRRTRAADACDGHGQQRMRRAPALASAAGGSARPSGHGARPRGRTPGSRTCVM
jgi:ATP/maltotriose-dependent transcriptional regulator MalT